MLYTWNQQNIVNQLYFSFKKRQIKLILYNLFQKMEENRMFPNSFCEASLTQVPKSDKDIKRKNHRQISLMDRCENSQKKKKKKKTQANWIQ